MAKVQHVHAREVLDSRGFPTVEAEVQLSSGMVGRAIVPSGASTGSFEALELRDGDPARFLGKGVLKAVQNVRGPVARALEGKSVESAKDVDQILLNLDSSPSKNTLGANAVLAASLAAGKALALEARVSFAEWIANQYRSHFSTASAPKMMLPVPLMNVINGGAHANNGLDIQEFMIVPHGFASFSDALRAGCEVFHHLKKSLSSAGLSTAVGDEGGFAPSLKSNQEALEWIVRAVESSGYKLGSQVSLALDVASTELFKNGSYHFKDSTIGTRSGEELCEVYAGWKKKFPIVSIEDGFAEDDWASWQHATKKLGNHCQLVGDDLFVTQSKRLKQGIDQKAANAILIKLNQVGSLSETLDTMALATSSGLRSIASHRSGETEDTSLAHLAVGTGCGQIKTGSASRTDRMAKYNELLRLEELLAKSGRAHFASPSWG